MAKPEKPGTRKKKSSSNKDEPKTTTKVHENKLLPAPEVGMFELTMIDEGGMITTEESSTEDVYETITDVQSTKKRREQKSKTELSCKSKRVNA